MSPPLAGAHCVNCFHWDEESAEDNIDGMGFCLMSEKATSDVPLNLLRGNRLVTIARTRGDYTCPYHRAKLATPRQSDEPVRE